MILNMHHFQNEDLETIEKEMKKIIKEGAKIERFELPRAEAIALMEEKGEPYKVELINDLPEDSVIHSTDKVNLLIFAPDLT